MRVVWAAGPWCYLTSGNTGACVVSSLCIDQPFSECGLWTPGDLSGGWSTQNSCHKVKMPFKVSVLEYSSIFYDSKSTVSLSHFCCILEYEGCLVGKHLRLLVASPRAVLSALERAAETQTAHSLGVFGTFLKMNQVSLFLQRKQLTVCCQRYNLSFQANLELWKMCFPCHKLDSFPFLTGRPDDIGANPIMFWGCVMKCVNLWKIHLTWCLPNDQYINYKITHG